MPETTELTGRVAAVTGGGSGLGAAMCRVFAGAGMAVAALDIDADAADATARELRATFSVPAHSVAVDVGDRASLHEAAAGVRAALGGCDVVCANVGVQQFGAIDRLTDDDWTWVVNVNVLGTIRTVEAFLPLLRERVGFRRILLTASSGALLPAARLGAYQTSKFAVVGYGETLRRELEAEGIGVTLLFPAGMITHHLASSARARPAEKGEWVLMPDDIEVMMASANLGAGDVATPDHAVRNLLADLIADQPYVVTHGGYRAAYHERLAGIEQAFDRMERSG
ncbi:MAG TPA: SDR family NAD(P)-dependent oxidoreductase [Acidimicrobiales bacterium]|nr:SDR family NAD(P)-dependent oxidoreductase [Acidimicrobiales bacterium]